MKLKKIDNGLDVRVIDFVEIVFIFMFMDLNFDFGEIDLYNLFEIDMFNFMLYNVI